MTDKNIKNIKDIKKTDNKPDRKRARGYTKTVSSTKMTEYENIANKVLAHLETGLNISSACEKAQVTRTRYYNAVKNLQNEKKDAKNKRQDFFSAHPIPIPTTAKKDIVKNLATNKKKDIDNINKIVKTPDKKDIVRTNKIVKKSEEKEESSEEVPVKNLVTNKKIVKTSNIKGGHDKSSSESSEESSSSESSEDVRKKKKKGSNNIDDKNNRRDREDNEKTKRALNALAKR